MFDSFQYIVVSDDDDDPPSEPRHSDRLTTRPPGQSASTWGTSVDDGDGASAMASSPQLVQNEGQSQHGRHVPTNSRERREEKGLLKPAQNGACNAGLPVEGGVKAAYDSDDQQKKVVKRRHKVQHGMDFGKSKKSKKDKKKEKKKKKKKQGSDAGRPEAHHNGAVPVESSHGPANGAYDAGTLTEGGGSEDDDEEEDSYLGVEDDHGDHGYQPEAYVDFNASSEHSQQQVIDVSTATFKKAFRRFEDTTGDHRGWSTEKDSRRGETGLVVGVFADQTLTLRFSDSEVVGFPFEALAKPGRAAPEVSPEPAVRASNGKARAKPARRTAETKLDPPPSKRQRKQPRPGSASASASLAPGSQIKMRQAFGSGKKICTREFAAKTLGVGPEVIDTMCNTGIAYRGWRVMPKSESMGQERVYPCLVDRQRHGGDLMHQVMFGAQNEGDEPVWMSREQVQALSGRIRKELAVYDTSMVPESEEAELYEAEYIMDETEKHYQVKWKGYSVEETTWEQKSTFGNARLANTFEFQKGIVDVWATITEIRSKTEIKEKVEIVDRRKNGSNRLYQLMLVNGDDSTEPFWRDRTDLEFMVDKLDEFDATIDRKEALTLATTQVWEVELIVGERRRYYGSQASIEYEVKWRGYPSEENTWESIEAILDETLVKKFHMRRDIAKAKTRMLQGMATFTRDPRPVGSVSSGPAGHVAHPIAPPVDADAVEPGSVLEVALHAGETTVVSSADAAAAAAAGHVIAASPAAEQNLAETPAGPDHNA